MKNLLFLIIITTMFVSCEYKSNTTTQEKRQTFKVGKYSSFRNISIQEVESLVDAGIARTCGTKLPKNTVIVGIQQSKDSLVYIWDDVKGYYSVLALKLNADSK